MADEEIILLKSDGSSEVIDSNLLIEYNPDANSSWKGYFLYKNEFVKMIGMKSSSLNKERKIDLFLQKQNLNGVVNATGKIMVNGTFEGYTMKFIQNQNFLFIELDDFINEIGSILEKLHKNNIIVGDLTLDQVLYDGNHYHLIGIDKFGIEDLPAHIRNHFLTRNFGYSSKQTDIIMFKKMVAEIILKRSFEEHSYLFFKTIVKLNRKIDTEMKKFLLSCEDYFVDDMKNVKIRKRLKPC